MSLTSWMKSTLRRHPRARRGLEPLLAVRRRLLGHRDEERRRFLIDLHSNVQSGRLVVTVDNFPGAYEMDIRSHILQRILLNKSYEPHLVKIVRERIDPRRDAIDVGANVGLFSTLMATLLLPERRVLAIEPTPQALEALQSNLDRNRCAGSVVVFSGVASDSPGRCTLNAVAGKEEYSSLGTIVHPSVEHETSSQLIVEAKTLDALVESTSVVPGFVKIDTEGAELLVLRGARQMLQVHRPVILTELSDLLLSSLHHTAREVLAYLEDAGYDAYDVATMGRPNADGFVGDVLAIPR